MNIKLAETEEEVRRCFPVLVQLRSHLTMEEYVRRAQLQLSEGYKLAYLEDGGEVKALGGFRIFEMFARGRFMYVDDLVTNETDRSKGYGDAIFDWLQEYALAEKCEYLNLDSGVQRFEAHRFYLRKRMHIVCPSLLFETLTNMNRRQFIQTTSIATLAMTTLEMKEAEAGVKWPIGCFNRPWTKWTIEDCLDGVKDAGYKTVGLLTPTKQDPFIRADASSEYLEGLRKKITMRGLKANMAALRVRADQPFEDAQKDLRQQIDHAHFLSVEHLLTFGVDQPKDYENYFKLMADAAPYCHERKIKLVMKPHGGASGASDEILAAIKKVNHQNFKIWYDAGNIIYYTGKDPIEELKPIVQYVTGFCAKDCGQPKGEVMIQFGTGKVDFHGVFAKLKSAGYKGPIMVECCTIGATAAETTANAKANREFLEKTLAGI